MRDARYIKPTRGICKANHNKIEKCPDQFARNPAEIIKLNRTVENRRNRLRRNSAPQLAHFIPSLKLSLPHRPHAISSLPEFNRETFIKNRRACHVRFSAAVLITVRVTGSQQDLNLRPVNRSPTLYPAELCEPVYPLELRTAAYFALSGCKAVAAVMSCLREATCLLDRGGLFALKPRRILLRSCLYP